MCGVDKELLKKLQVENTFTAKLQRAIALKEEL
jgi:hypothetical protein